MYTSFKVRDLYQVNNKWSFTLWLENDDVKYSPIHFVTNEYGTGLFYEFTHNQKEGTCDFSLRGKSMEAARLYIKRWAKKVYLQQV